MVVSPDPGLSIPANRILLVLGQTPFPVELLDSRCNVLYCNIAYARTFLGSMASILGRPTPVFPEVLSGGQPRQAVLEQAWRNGLWKGEVSVTDASGAKLPLRVSVFPIQHPSDELLEYAVFYEDIRQEVETREALIHQQNLVAIRSRQAQMGELLSMIAHQWRQPLTVITSLVGNIQLKAQMGAVDADYLASKLERISQTVHFLSETIDSFRNFYMPTKYKTDEDVATLTHRALELLTPSLQELGVQVGLEVPPDPVVIRLFGGEFVQVLLELLANARDALASAANQPRVLHITVTRVGPEVVVTIGNNGGDIPPTVLPRIFDPYFTTKEGTAGTGLGLHMAKIIVENHHGGTLSAFSHGGWTEFQCRVPPGEAQ